MTLSNLLHIFFDSYSANAKKYQYNHLKNKRNHIKKHNAILTSSAHTVHNTLFWLQVKKICGNKGRLQRQTESMLKMKAKYKAKALQKYIFEIRYQAFICSINY